MKQSIRIITVGILLYVITGCLWGYKDDLDIDIISDTFDAVENNDVDALQALFDRNPNIIIAKDIKKQYTPLARAAILDHVEVAQWLIDNGADLEAKDRYTKKTPLHYAAESNSTGVAELLLESGANLSARSMAQRTPKDLAEFSGHKDVLQIFDKY